MPFLKPVGRLHDGQRPEGGATKIRVILESRKVCLKLWLTLYQNEGLYSQIFEQNSNFICFLPSSCHTPEVCFIKYSRCTLDRVCVV